MTDMAAPERVDLLIHARWLVPVVPHGVVLEQHSIAIAKGGIIAVLPTAQARTRYVAGETVELPAHALVPGLVNAHTHNPMTLLRGYADDLPLEAWLQDHIWPAEARILGPEMVRDGVTLAIVEMLRSGTTCCNENYFFPDVQAATYRRHGFRAMVGLPVVEFANAWAQSADVCFDKALTLHDELRDDPLIGAAFAPHAPYTVSDDSFKRIGMWSEQLDIPVHLHLHETAREVADSVRDHGVRPFARLKAMGLVNHRLIAVHMTQLTAQEVADCAQGGVSVVHNAQSNLKLASGLCPVADLLDAGVNVAIGTDGAASNNDLDMFDEMRTAALLAKGVSGDATAMDAAATLRAATLGGATALGWESRIGSIEVGKRADLVAVRMDAVELQPLHNVLSNLVYVAGREHVSDVWIDGVCKMRERIVADIDMDEVLVTAARWRQRLAAPVRG